MPSEVSDSERGKPSSVSDSESAAEHGGESAESVVRPEAPGRNTYIQKERAGRWHQPRSELTLQSLAISLGLTNVISPPCCCAAAPYALLFSFDLGSRAEEACVTPMRAK